MEEIGKLIGAKKCEEKIHHTSWDEDYGDMHSDFYEQCLVFVVFVFLYKKDKRQKYKKI